MSTEPSAAPDLAAALVIPAAPAPEAIDATPPNRETEVVAAPAPAALPSLDPAAVAALLRQHFPALFSGQAKPIKLHIQADIQARAPGLFSKRSLSAFLHRHTGSTSYLMALSRAAHRFDLDGQPAGELTDEHREVAAQELARRRALQDERRALERAQQQQEQQQQVLARQQQQQERQHQELLNQQRFNRAGLLRAFETTTLTRANFCVLKQVADSALDELLEMAKRERTEAPPALPQRPPFEVQRRAPDERRPARDGQRPPRDPARDTARDKPRGPGHDARQAQPRRERQPDANQEGAPARPHNQPTPRPGSR